MTKEVTTLRVSKTVSARVKRAAVEAKLSMYEYVNLALDWFTQNTKTKIETKERDNGDQGAAG